MVIGSSAYKLPVMAKQSAAALSDWHAVSEVK